MVLAAPSRLARSRGCRRSDLLAGAGEGRRVERVLGDHQHGVAGPDRVEREVLLAEPVPAAHSGGLAEALALRRVGAKQIHVEPHHLGARALVGGADGSEVVTGLHDDGDELGLDRHLDVLHDLLGGAGAQPEEADQERHDDAGEADHGALLLVHVPPVEHALGQGVGGGFRGGGVDGGLVQGGPPWPG